MKNIDVLGTKLLKLKGVVGYSDPVEKNRTLTIYLESSDDIKATPNILSGGIEIKKVVIGKVVALRTQMYRPLVGGISIGTRCSGSGTLACITRNNLILSNMHVIGFDWCNNIEHQAGEPIFQPSLDDGGNTNSIIGYYYKSIPIIFNSIDATNYADASIGVLREDVVANQNTVLIDKNNAVAFGGVTDDVKPNETVYKSGRTSGWTASNIIDDSATVKVSYDQLGYAVFGDVIFVKQPFALPGDSGSLVLNNNARVVGLVFAGSERVAVVCKQKYFTNQLGLDFGSPMNVDLSKISVTQRFSIHDVAKIFSLSMLGTMLLLRMSK